MDRILVYPGALPQETDVLNAERYAMVGLSSAIAALLDDGTWLDRLVCSATNPTSMSVQVGPGSIFTVATVDSSAFSSLPIDTRGIFKAGQNLDVVSLPLSAPTTPGYAVNYLIAGSFSETDTGAQVLPYYNAANPAQAFSGPAGGGEAQFTQRIQRCALQLIAGVSAPAGSQVTPAAPQGTVPMYVITVDAGQSSIAQGNISVHPNAPFLRAKLNQFGGGGGDFATHTEVANAVAPKANSASPVFSGNPTTPTPADNDNSGSIPNTAWVDRAANEIASAYANSVRFPETMACYDSNSSGAVFTIPGGVSRIKVSLVGAGGGGSGCDGSQAGAGGGAGGTAVGWFAVAPGQQFAMLIGAGGAGAGPGGTGGAGGSTSFGSLLSASGGGGGSILAGSAGGAGYGGQLNVLGGYGTDSSRNDAIFGGMGGFSSYGSGGRPSTGDQPSLAAQYMAGKAYGSGGAGGYGPLAVNGGAGASGFICIEF